MQKIYTCKYCEKSFPSNEARNGHQNWCKSNPKSQQRKKNLSSKMAGLSYGTKPTKQKYNIQCAKCGKQFELELTQYLYESGKYRKHCSRTCANSRIWTDVDKFKKSNSAKHSYKVKKANNRPRMPWKYKQICKICPICLKKFITNNSKNQIYCSQSCYKLDKHCQFRNVNKTPICSGYHKGCGIGKSGWYKGIWCDSSWELAYVMYHLDHKMSIKRNNQKRTYIWNGKQYNYIPDFNTDQGIIEIKGYIDQKWNEKYLQNPDVKVLYKDQIQPYLQYAISKYGKDFINLYE